MYDDAAQRLNAYTTRPFQDRASFAAWLRAEGPLPVAERAARRAAAVAAGRQAWTDLCMPQHALGYLEEDLLRLAAAQGQWPPQLQKRAIFVFCADHGIVAEGVSQSGPEVTAQVLRNIAARKSSASLWADRLGLDCLPVDLAVRDYQENDPGIVHWKISSAGTANFAKGPALTEAELYAALAAGAAAAEWAWREGYGLVVGGEMGIGNTSSSTALIAAQLGLDPAAICGCGAGLSQVALSHKAAVLRTALAVRGCSWSEPSAATQAGQVRDGGTANGYVVPDPLTALREFGGFELAALCGLYLAAAKLQLPVLLDGLITAAAALTAVRLEATVAEHLLPTHRPREKGAAAVYQALGWQAPLDLNLALGEGSGALLYVPLLDLTLEALTRIPSFAEGGVEAYVDYREVEQTNA